MVGRNKPPEAAGLASVGNWSCGILPDSYSNCVNLRLSLPAFWRGWAPSLLFATIAMLLLAQTKQANLLIPSSNLLQMRSYLPPWILVLGTLYTFFKNYDPIVPINQNSPSYSLFLDFLLGIRRKTEMYKIPTLWENSNFINILKYSLHVDRLNGLKVFSNLNDYTILWMQIIFQTQFSLPTQSLHPIFHLNQVLPACICAFKDRNLHYPKVFAPLHRNCCRNLLQKKAIPPPCCFNALQGLIQFIVTGWP